MSEQVTLETYQRITAGMPPEQVGAKFYRLSLDEGLLFGATRHAAEDRWDWAATAHSLLTAQDRWRQAEKLVTAMTPQQRALLWLDGHPQRELLRKVARGMP